MAYKRISPTPVNEGGTGALTLTDHGLLFGSGTAAITASAVGSTGQILQGVTGADPAYSTATYPSTAGASGKVLLSNGTNYVDSTPTFPNASATSGKFIRSDGTNWIASTPTLPTSAGTAGKILVSDATNYIESTPTFPNASATTRKIIVSDGTNWTASTETYAVPGTSGNVLTSDGTNWTSAASAGGGIGGSTGATDNAVLRADGVGGATLQNSTMIITDAGEMTNASQPAFLAYLNTSVLNVSGDTTIYTIIYDTEVFDQNADFNIATGVFTAPVTGRHTFHHRTLVTGGSTITLANGALVTSNRTYRVNGQTVVGGGATNAITHQSWLTDMDSADTCSITIATTDSGGKIDDISGLISSNIQTFFSGNLSC